MADEENAYTFTTTATRRITLGNLPAGGMPMWRGGSLPEVTLAYESWGELSAAADNAIIIFTGLSPSAHAASSTEDASPGWWEYMIGPGKAIDTNRFFVVCANSLGGCYGSTGPGSVNPETGRDYGADFPDVTVEDIASSGYYLMRELGVEKIHAAVGSSMGGMASIAYAMQYPGEIKYLISISAATQALPLTIALRSLQREIIRSDPDWNNGQYSDDTRPLSDQATARWQPEATRCNGFSGQVLWPERIATQGRNGRRVDELGKQEFLADRPELAQTPLDRGPVLVANREIEHLGIVGVGTVAKSQRGILTHLNAQNIFSRIYEELPPLGGEARTPRLDRPESGAPNLDSGNKH